MDYVEWNAKIRAQYPDLFGERCRNDTPDGWQDIITDMCSRLSAVDDLSPIVQIKEKFGGLRVYFNTVTPDAAEAIIADAERACEETCDICGQHGKLIVSHQVYKVVCPDHENFMKERLR